MSIIQTRQSVMGCKKTRSYFWLVADNKTILSPTSRHCYFCSSKFFKNFDYRYNLMTIYKEVQLRTTVPFVTADLEIFHCTHHPVILKSDLYFTFCSTLNALSKRTSK